MDGLKGVHALATTVLILFIAYVSYGFVQSFFNSVDDTVLNAIMWGTYILTLLVCALGVPALIAFGEGLS